jgi:hypothetical protein
MNLLREIEDGQRGKKLGLTTGDLILDKMLLGIRKGTTTLIASKEKVGKSKFVRHHWILQPYLKEVLGNKKNVKWILLTLEEPRYKVEADIISGLCMVEGMYIPRSKMLGEDIDADGRLAKLNQSEFDLIKRMYETHIIPLFGEHDENGTIQEGLVTTYEHSMTPARYNKILTDFAESNLDTHPIVIVDDYRLFSNSDKTSLDLTFQIEVDITQKYKLFSIVGIMHLNRSNVDFNRIQAIGPGRYYPDSSLIKDTGNGGERKHSVITLFNPSDPGFEIPVHFGTKVKPDYRSVHLVTSRDTQYPMHAQCSFNGFSFTNYKSVS